MEDPQHDGTSSGGSEHTGEPTIDGQEPVPSEAGNPSPAEAGGDPGPSDQAKAADEEHWLSCDACGRWRRVDLPTMREFEGQNVECIDFKRHDGTDCRCEDPCDWCTKIDCTCKNEDSWEGYEIGGKPVPPGFTAEIMRRASNKSPWLKFLGKCDRCNVTVSADRRRKLDDFLTKHRKCRWEWENLKSEDFDWRVPQKDRHSYHKQSGGSQQRPAKRKRAGSHDDNDASRSDADSEDEHAGSSDDDAGKAPRQNGARLSRAAALHRSDSGLDHGADREGSGRMRVAGQARGNLQISRRAAVQVDAARPNSQPAAQGRARGAGGGTSQADSALEAAKHDVAPGAHLLRFPLAAAESMRAFMVRFGVEKAAGAPLAHALCAFRAMMLNAKLVLSSSHTATIMPLLRECLAEGGAAVQDAAPDALVLATFHTVVPTDAPQLLPLLQQTLDDQAERKAAGQGDQQTGQREQQSKPASAAPPVLDGHQQPSSEPEPETSAAAAEAQGAQAARSAAASQVHIMLPAARLDQHLSKYCHEHGMSSDFAAHMKAFLNSLPSADQDIDASVRAA